MQTEISTNDMKEQNVLKYSYKRIRSTNYAAGVWKLNFRWNDLFLLVSNNIHMVILPNSGQTKGSWTQGWNLGIGQQSAVNMRVRVCLKLRLALAGGVYVCEIACGHKHRLFLGRTLFVLGIFSLNWGVILPKITPFNTFVKSLLHYLLLQVCILSLDRNHCFWSCLHRLSGSKEGQWLCESGLLRLYVGFAGLVISIYTYIKLKMKNCWTGALTAVTSFSDFTQPDCLLLSIKAAIGNHPPAHSS